MVDAETLKQAVIAEFAQTDTTTLSLKAFIAALSTKLGEDLAADKEQKQCIKEMVVALLNPPVKEEEGEDSDEDEEKEEEEEKPKKKGGYQAQLQLSEEFGAFLGAETMSRTEIVKQMWVYFKEKDLQNPKDRRQILLDEPLQAIFKVKKFTMFSMNKFITKHAWTPEVQDESESESDEDLVEDVERPKKTVAKKKKAPVKVKGEKGGAKKEKKARDPNAKKAKQTMHHLSDDLSKVVGSSEMSRPQVLKNIWVYIRSNNLQNPDDKREILCDDKMAKVMGGEASVTMFNMNKYTGAHILEKTGKLYDPN